MKPALALFVLILSSLDVCLCADVPKLLVSNSGTGNMVNLRWDAGEAEETYLSNVGRVSQRGEAILPRSPSGCYTMVVQGNKGVQVATVLYQQDSKGTDFPSDLDSFRFPIYVEQTGASLISMLTKIHSILQDEFKYSVDESCTRTGTYRFVTSFLEDDNLTDVESKRIAVRRIAYLVEVKEKAGEPTKQLCTIKALLQYQMKLESTWRTENDAEAYRSKTDKIREKLP